ncbi:MarR family transcriptional regulator [Labrenzia sp. 011]|uniref:MarR family winged helix-turn-helix transcriptional regulator n=1 Tax=Labrenzia sp. 011 TaxID=2171494 RepID=UPI000D511D8E|nr:MarR family transcriptional regulator [Labrenzia sp. 011]PVB63075.1 MarR family transcriptional regulator [Labrenzia sp. 011]
MDFEKDRSAGYLANHMARLFAIALHKTIAPLGLAPAQFMTLLELWTEEGLTQRDLVLRLDVEQATMANTLARMERDGLITRKPHPEDRRSQSVWLTPRARALEKPAKSAAASVNGAALAGLSQAERDRFLQTMARIIANLRKSA